MEDVFLEDVLESMHNITYEHLLIEVNEPLYNI